MRSSTLYISNPIPLHNGSIKVSLIAGFSHGQRYLRILFSSQNQYKTARDADLNGIKQYEVFEYVSFSLPDEQNVDLIK